MAKTFIKASEVQKGDHIKVTYMDRGMKETRTGVADYQHRYNSENWYNKDGVLFYTHLLSATIQLLDRPKPAIVLPTGEGAVVEYWRVGDTIADRGQRIATLSSGKWNVKAQMSPNTAWYATDPGTVSPEWLTHMVNSDGVVEYTVHFAGVSK